MRPTATTAHAEAIAIGYGPTCTNDRTLLGFIFQIHDPTTKNRQSNDVGISYRSAIFYLDDEQKRIALDTIADVEASGLWPGTVVTESQPAGDFWEAEPEQQDHLQRYPGAGTPATSSGSTANYRDGPDPHPVSCVAGEPSAQPARIAADLAVLHYEVVHIRTTRTTSDR